MIGVEVGDAGVIDRHVMLPLPSTEAVGAEVVTAADSVIVTVLPLAAGAGIGGGDGDHRGTGVATAAQSRQSCPSQ